MGEWKAYRLGDLTDWFSGGTPSKSNESYWNGDIPWISAKTMSNNKISSSDLNISKEGLENGSRIAEISDILLLVRGSGLFNGIPICWVDKPVAFNQDIKAIRAKDSTNQEFIYYWLHGNKKALYDILEETGIGAGKFDTDLLKNLEICIPVDESEKAILVTTAKSIFDKIDLLHRQNKTLEALAETLFRQWFVEEAGEGWKSQIGELPIEIIDGDRGKNYPKQIDLLETGDCLFLSAKNVTSDGFEFNQCQFISSEKDSLLRSGKLKRNDLIITTRGTVGNIAYYHDLINFSNIRINSGMIILRTKPEILDPIFVLCLIKSSYFKYQIENQTSGSAQPQIPIRDLRQIEVFFPPKEQRINFLKIVKPCLNKKFHNELQIRTLEKLRDTLLPKLMRGEVRVSAL